MTDYEAGIKKQVAEVKFLIHDLRVEKFINDVIHFHVTLNTDLEIHDVDQAQVLHNEDLKTLKERALTLRRSFRDYSSAVRSFSPPETVLGAGKRHIENIYEMCELILNPLWGRVDKVMDFLPPESRSVRSRNHYRNSIRWICGVYYRIEHFFAELEDIDLYEEFDAAHDLSDFTRNVVYGYVMEKSRARVELQLERLDSAILGGNRHRFRRMYFNLIMNAVDAMLHQKVGILNVNLRAEGEQALLRVRDTGSGMPEAKISQLLADKETLDGELHSLGFVFVRQTIADFAGELSIESEEGKGTTMFVRLPTVRGAAPRPRRVSRCEKYDLVPAEGDHSLPGLIPPRSLQAAAPAAAPAPPQPAAAEVQRVAETGKTNRLDHCGELVMEAYRESKAQHRGSIFAMSVTAQNKVDLFTCQPYERHWNISHEDLAPMYFLAVIRGRLEDDDLKAPLLVLKAPQSEVEFFDLKELDQDARSAGRFLTMVHDEYVRVARKLIDTGMEPTTGVQLTDMAKFFPDPEGMSDHEPFPLSTLAGRALSME